MELSALVLVIALTSQAGHLSQPSAATARPTPQDLAAEAVRLPAPKAAKYREVSLTEVLTAASRDPGQRLQVVQAYWRLWQAFADQVIAQTMIDQIQPVARAAKAGTVDGTLLDAELASAQAGLEAAEVAIRTAQVELCALLGWNATGSMPRPLDPPHVGIYHSHFEKIYARRAPTERARLIHQTLPIYREAIAAHGVARQAADDVVVEQVAGYTAPTPQIAVESLINAWQQRARQQQVLCRVTWEYNNLIAEYAVPLAGQSMETPKLVGMLIRSSTSTATRRSRDRAEVTSPYDSEVAPAGYNQPIGTVETSEPEPEPIEWEASNAETTQPAYQDYGNEFEVAPAAAEQFEDSAAESVRELEGAVEGAVDEAAGAASEAAPVEDLFGRDQASQRTAARHVVAKPVVKPMTNAVFAKFTAPNAAPRAVIETIFTRTKVVDQNETSVNLRQCLGSTSPTLHGELLDAYAEAWRAATVYQAYVDAAAQLQAAKTALMARLNDGGAAADMLVVRAAETANAAAMIEAEAAIWESTLALGTVALPRTAGGRALPSQDAPVWAAAAGLPQAKALNARAQSLVMMDKARTQATQEYAAGGSSIGLTLQAVRRQNEETQDFAATVADAARESGRAILAQLPPHANVDTVRQALLGTPTSTARPGDIRTGGAIYSRKPAPQ
ncbi:MAG: hypothetical protein SGJ19_08300 [Planctomycetia bacterium]|nr:hypothetical protein [Planctomycetia bacterium]